MNWKKLLICTSTFAAITTINFAYAQDANTTSQANSNSLTFDNSTKVTGANTTTLTSAEIGSLATIAAIDKLEILLGVIASNKKTSSGVADFAKMMIDQHGSNLTQLLEMVNNMHASSLKGGASEDIHTQGMKAMMMLGGLQGDAFDKAYVDAMVKGHQAALDMIDQKLMKTATSDDVKKFLTDTRAAVVQHLDAAKKLQTA